LRAARLTDDRTHRCPGEQCDQEDLRSHPNPAHIPALAAACSNPLIGVKAKNHEWSCQRTPVRPRGKRQLGPTGPVSTAWTESSRSLGGRHPSAARRAVRPSASGTEAQSSAPRGPRREHARCPVVCTSP
jgi:hypothetical protein